MSKSKKFGKPLKVFLIIYISFLAIVGIVSFFLACTSPEVRFHFQSEQQTQVEVVEKNIDRHVSRGGRRSRASTIYTYLISFQFPDGTVKEFEADKFVLSGVREETPYSSIYAGINEGDMGLLAYKELDRRTIDFYDDLTLRKFIRFKQDAEYGGETFRWIDRDRKNKIITIGFLLLLLSAGAFILVCAWIYNKKMKKEKEQRKLLIRERAEQQAAWQRQQSQEEKQRIQAQEEQQQKRKRQKQRQKRQRKKQRK